MRREAITTLAGVPRACSLSWADGVTTGSQKRGHQAAHLKHEVPQPCRSSGPAHVHRCSSTCRGTLLDNAGLFQRRTASSYALDKRSDVSVALDRKHRANCMAGARKMRARYLHAGISQGIDL